MATTNRQSLPTIKCSMCAKDIEISELGDHVCGPAGEPTPPLEQSSTFDKLPFKKSPANGPGYLKPLRAPPPRVDTSAANRPYLPQDQLTPVSASPRHGSPMDGRKPPFRPQAPPRSATAPVFRPPPSPEMLSSNLDCAFPVFPTAKVQQTLKPQQARAHGGRYAEANPMYAPVSPRTASSGKILERMNTIAPGPFDINRRKENSPVAQTHRRQGTAGSLSDLIMASGNEKDDSVARPSTAGGPGHSRTSTNSSDGSRSGFATRGPKKNGYEGFGPPTSEPGTLEPPPRVESRSRTLPTESATSNAPPRRPSESRSMSRPRQTGGERKQSLTGPDLSRPLPPRGASLIRPRVITKDGEAPAIPNLNLAEEFGVGNPYHTPTDSQSSDKSGFSEESQASSRSSPPQSFRGYQSRRKGSNDSPVDSLVADLESSLSVSPKTDLPLRASPPRNKRPIGLPVSPKSTREQLARPMMPEPILKNTMLAPESPMDPAIQMGLPSLAVLPPRSESARSDHSNSSERRSAPSKGNCKGCSEPIKGKSISSADGRLTGRYHRHCFVCKTCAEPFQTSTFYVIDDAPFCERHYHKLNGSTCTTCDKGIEGPYIESERSQKFHPGCLACADCKRVLKRDYFEMNGRVYCERDAWKRSQQPKGPGAGLGVGMNRMERRTTRMMMM